MEIKELLDNYGMTEEMYNNLLSTVAEKLEGENSITWQEIVDDYNIPYTSDSVRKACTLPLLGGYWVNKYYKDKTTKYIVNSDTELKHRIKMERQKLSDERTAINRTLREQARLETDLNYLASRLHSIGSERYPVGNRLRYRPFENDITADTKEMIVCLSDIHMGLDIQNSFGKYNQQVILERLADYIFRIYQIKETHRIDRIHVLLLGDLISGSIHSTVRLEERENAITQSQLVAEMISDFLYELSEEFETVVVNSVSGNHSRIGFKDEVLRNNRLDNIIPWYIQGVLNHVDNISFVTDENIDPTIGKITILGKDYWLVHGDFDSLDKSGLTNLILKVGIKPQGIFYGHLHSCEYKEISGVQMIRSGSLCDPCDNYSIQKRMTGQASQTVCIVNSSGIECCYFITF